MSTKRAGPFAIVWRAIFAAPFVLVGLASLVGGIGTLQPALVIFGAIFTAAGAFVVWTGVRDTRSAESRGKVIPGVGRLTLAPLGDDAFRGYRANGGPREPTALEVYGAQLAHLPVAPLATARGRALPVALGRRDSPWALLAFAIVWNAVCVPFFVGAVAAKTIGAVILLLFVGIGLLMLAGAIKRIVAARKAVALEIEVEPVHLGAPMKIHVSQRGPISVERLTAAIVCEERTTAGAGRTTRREQREVYREEILDEIGLKVARGETWTRSLSVRLPAGPASFRSLHNEIAWTISVKAQIEGWPDYEESFVFRALPKVTP